jgi:asparagine synthase (glutamine-hydrolysing)
MAVGLEAREPLLDYRLLEFSCRIPDCLKLRDKVTKWILREIAKDLLPREIVNLPKRGFSVPLGDWLRSSLRNWAEDLINPKRLNEEGFFVSSKIIDKWQDHICRRSNWEYPLWNVLVFQSWLSYWKQNLGNNVINNI